MTFSASWLALREPFDAAARNPAVCRAALARLAGHASVTIVDIACGTGSLLRALSPRIAAHQEWRLADNDLGLLMRASSLPRPDNVTVTTMPLDLNRDLEAALDGPVDLVTASALLDLVSANWLDRLAIELAARRLPFYAPLNYDGRIAFDPADAFDARIVAAVNAHQRRDKGFGPALGPDAANAAMARFTQLGYAVTDGESDWQFVPDDREISFEILNGWAEAAQETGEISRSEANEWLGRRREIVNAGRSSIRVGHRDLFAAPPAAR